MQETNKYGQFKKKKLTENVHQETQALDLLDKVSK